MSKGNDVVKKEADWLFREAEAKQESRDNKGAFQCLLRGAKLGDTSCMVNLGNFYAAGTGTRKDHREARLWYRRAWVLGDVCGANNLAVEYRLQGNYRAAAFWFRRAVARNDGDACVELAKMLRARRARRSTVVNLLQKATASDWISEAGREEAADLLRAFQKS